MAVNPLAQGDGIGFELGIALIKKARERGFKRIVLEANSKMKASIALYNKLGFIEYPISAISNIKNLHRRCDVFMELVLQDEILPEYFL